MGIYSAHVKYLNNLIAPKMYCYLGIVEYFYHIPFKGKISHILSPVLTCWGPEEKHILKFTAAANCYS